MGGVKWYTKLVKCNIGVTPRLLSVVIILVMGLSAFGEETPSTEDQLSPQFIGMSKEASLGCALLLPGNVPGVPNMMDLCGGTYAFKIAPTGMLESRLMMGNGSGQSYYLGSFSYRGDMYLNDLIVSVYGGLDIVDANSIMYGGISVGGAIWWEITDAFFLRSDLELQINPGTSMLILFSAVLRFDAGGGGGQ